MRGKGIVVLGARQHNLKGLDLEVPLRQLTVVTGVSGSGKSTLVFDILYAEGQRRYVETFSAYARQFLERMDRPQVDEIRHIPPAIAIDQTNPVKTSRSTVGTMTGIADYLRLLFARAGQLFCHTCGRWVRRESPQSIYDNLRIQDHSAQDAVILGFPLTIPASLPLEEALSYVSQQGFTRVWAQGEIRKINNGDWSPQHGVEFVVVVDRVRVENQSRQRFIDSIELCMKFGSGRVYVVHANGAVDKHSAHLHCPFCNIEYAEPHANLFSFNSPLGACPECKGFGRIITIDPALVIPDVTKSILEGAIKPWTTDAYAECQEDLIRFCKKSRIPFATPWKNLSEDQKARIFNGSGDFYGVVGFFEWLESKSYKMHIRVLLSKYRAYIPCPTCGGSRLRPEASWYRVGGKTIGALNSLSIGNARDFFHAVPLGREDSKATRLILNEIQSRLDYLAKVGVDYLTLDRQSRTLSGGEAERVDLTRALGGSLVETLYVLDEPSIGLHPRDMKRLVTVLHEIRDRGNTVVMVEHDPVLIAAADHIIDLGPAAGTSGGHVVYSGKPEKILRCTKSATGKHLKLLSGNRKPLLQARRVDLDSAVRLCGARQHNLKSIDVAIPRGILVCLTGVSGSGKSTLAQDVLEKAIRNHKELTAEGQPIYDRLEGYENITGTIFMDQTALSASTRVNAATCVKAFDGIRRCFAETERARSRGYCPGTFSFNAGDGRCETCQGTGFEIVEMQFLSDVYLSCPTCGGERYKSGVLEVRFRGRNIAEVLAMTVSDACRLFCDIPSVREPLSVLESIGLGYVALGQPASTLSQGENQRLKLARHLVSFPRSTSMLFVLDEPTTGLHLADIEVLLTCFDRILERGHTLLVIEHNLEVIRNSHWIIDLGPEGGERGGTVVAMGTPDQIMKIRASHTGRHLREYVSGSPQVKTSSILRKPQRKEPIVSDSLRIVGAHEHNLRNLSVDIPRDKFVVVTGVSGSGKSSLVFDVVFSEGQRRYLDGLSAFARMHAKQLPRAEVDHIEGIPPAVAIEQRRSQSNRKSTVGTMTEVYHCLRLLFARCGVPYCCDCDAAIHTSTVSEETKRIVKTYLGKTVRVFAPLIRSRKGYYLEVAQWAVSKGYSWLRVDGRMVRAESFSRLERFREHDIDLLHSDGVYVEHSKAFRNAIHEAFHIGHGSVLIQHGRKESLFSTKRVCTECGKSFPELDPRMFSFNSPHGACSRCDGLGTLDWEGARICPECSGARLSAQSRSVLVAGRTIIDFTRLSVSKALREFQHIRLAKREREISESIFRELLSKLQFLEEVGLGYLTLDRSGDTLAGGECQRVRLAAQLGSNLRGVCYVLDEPTIGLHPRDNELLLSSLTQLKQRGNSVLVVEHDEETIRRAEYVIDLGPGPGRHGGKIVSQGSLRTLLQCKASKTAQWLKNPLKHPMNGQRRSLENVKWMEILGAKANNLKNVNARFPLQRLSVVTGVSGSGKSSLVREALCRALGAKLQGNRIPKHCCSKLVGWESLSRALEVDQTPIGRTPRSCVATYVGLMSEIRNLFAMATEAKMLNYGPARFSFNVPGGRCEKCLGQGRLDVEMNFLPNVTVPCDDCEGRQYNQDTLKVRYKDKSIADVLAMSAEEAVGFFENIRSLRETLQLLNDIGLGYLTLGQTSPSLSGGEAQRIKLASELSRSSRNACCYFIEEPTTGLHGSDVANLLNVLHALADKGHTLIVIEHHLDVIAEADYVLDIGPESGDAGGRIVAEGTPENIAAADKGQSYTAGFLAKTLGTNRK